MELTIGVSVGSSIQIAAGMIPLLVIIAWPMNKDLTLFFVRFFQTIFDRFGLSHRYFGSRGGITASTAEDVSRH